MIQDFITYKRAEWLRQNGFPQDKCKWRITKKDRVIGRKFSTNHPVRPSFEEIKLELNQLEIAKSTPSMSTTLLGGITDSNATEEHWQLLLNLWESTFNL